VVVREWWQRRLNWVSGWFLLALFFVQQSHPLGCRVWVWRAVRYRRRARKKEFRQPPQSVEELLLSAPL
jgi:hypothetical protein